MRNALKDLTADPNVLAIYLGGSLAKKNFDNYSDIDLHTIVKSEKRSEFIEKKCERAGKWGNVLFHEYADLYNPVMVTHYDCFVKIDSWYHALEEIAPSIWLKGLKVLYDPNSLISNIIKESSNFIYKLRTDEVELWKGKILAFTHETYRTVMRNELYYAQSNLDKIRWLIVSGWYMEINEHFDGSYGSWSKVEGKRSTLNQRQLCLLETWKCGSKFDEIMATVESMVPEILRLNTVLSEEVGLETKEAQFKDILEMVY
nr:MULTISPECIES: aminoglycoside 6-adenylyltransferase [unclassified Planococcus (in: firmicutes)]